MDGTQGRSRFVAVGVAFLVVLGGLGSLWASGQDSNDGSEIVEWVIGQNTGSVGNGPSLREVVAVSEETTEPLQGIEVRLTVQTDGEMSELVLTVRHEPCAYTFALGVVEPMSSGEFVFSDGAQSTIGIPVERSLASPRCEVPRPDEFLDSLTSGTFTLTADDGEIEFTATGSDRSFRFLTL